MENRCPRWRSFPNYSIGPAPPRSLTRISAIGRFGIFGPGLWGRPLSGDQAETRAGWQAAEAAWRASPLAGDDHVYEVARSIAVAVADQAERRPATAILVEIALAADRQLRLEDVEPFEVDWPSVDADPRLSMEARKSFARRARWARQYDRHVRHFERSLINGFGDAIEALPESCFQAWSEEPQFSVSLASLLDDPAEAIERLIMSIYTDETFALDLFERLRGQLATNLVVASGFSPSIDPHEVSQRLVLPTGHRGKSGPELAELYLRHTPLLNLFELPVPFEVPASLRFEHCHIIGGTGHGKTQLMQRLIHGDLAAAREDGRSVVVIDSQGDLIRKIMRLELFSPFSGSGLADRLVVIDPSDVEYPAALNLFDAHLSRITEYGPADRERVVNGVIELFETFFGALLGAELTQKQGVIFRYLARLMLTIPGATIQTLMELMEDGAPYRSHMRALEGSARHFFEKEFFHPSFAATKRQILKRLWGVLATPAFERMFVQSENKLDLFEATQQGKIILISTAKDLLKTEGSQLFGRFFIAMLAQAALERSTVPEADRTPTYVYVDEAQEYFDDTIETILSQARKYRMGITLAHQTLDQLSPRLRAAFLANTSLKCAGGVSAKDARSLAPELRTSSEFIEGMRRRHDRSEFAVWLKHRTPEALRLSVPLGFLEREPTMPEEDLDFIIERNRERYCGSRSEGAWGSGSGLPIAIDTVDEHSPGAGAPPPAAAQAPARQSDEQAVRAHGTPRSQPQELGKGGATHRYLQSLIAELAHANGFRATVEAPLASGGQVDVLIERDGLAAAFEISVTTPAERERENARKCLAANFARVAVVLTKSRTSQDRYRAAIVEGLSDRDRARLSFVLPEELPDFISSLCAPAEPDAPLVAGYKIRSSRTVLAPEESQSRRELVARIISRSLARKNE